MRSYNTQWLNLLSYRIKTKEERFLKIVTYFSSLRKSIFKKNLMHLISKELLFFAKHQVWTIFLSSWKLCMTVHNSGKKNLCFDFYSPECCIICLVYINRLIAFTEMPRTSSSSIMFAIIKIIAKAATSPNLVAGLNYNSSCSMASVSQKFEPSLVAVPQFHCHWWSTGPVWVLRYPCPDTASERRKQPTPMLATVYASQSFDRRFVSTIVR